jgi:hypothetical protein
MKLIALVDRAGLVRAWTDRRKGWIANLNGNVFALIEFDGVFKFNGEQIGWFGGDHLRDRLGRVILARPGAKIEGLDMPPAQKIPSPPKMHVPTGRPLLKWLLPPPMKRRVWADFESLFDDGLAQVRAFEEMLGAWLPSQLSRASPFAKRVVKPKSQRLLT